MRLSKPILLVGIILMAVASRAVADYGIGDFHQTLGQATHVVDATVTEITKEKYARLDVLRHIKGTNAPTLLKSTYLSCTNEPPGAFGMLAGRRYIIMLRNDALYEESRYFEVVKGDDGTLGCRLSEWNKKWLGASDSWVALDDMTRLMTPQPKK